MTDVDFTGFLVDHGLMAAGSTETMHALEALYGRRRWFGFADVIDLPAASLFPEQTEPFFFLASRTCLLPPSELECDFDYHRDALRTHACALERLTALFGAPEKGEAVNTLSETWKFERMSLRILTFMREKTSSRSDLYIKHPELWNFCRISINRDWVRPMTETDKGVLDALGPHQILPLDFALWPKTRYLLPWERGLFRPAGFADTPPFLWKQGASIGWSAAPWLAFFGRSSCSSLILKQALPSRGGGYSRLVLKLRNPFSLEFEPVKTELLAGAETHTLDRVAPEVAAFWELPISTEEDWDD